MIEQNPKRSNEPIFWGLFGAGGMWSAIFLPVVIIIVAFILPFSSMVTMASILDAASSWLGRLFLAATIILPLWCGAHRIHHGLHDIKVHLPASNWILYGFAAVLTLLTIYGVIVM